MFWARIAALAIFVGVTLWIGSGYIGRATTHAPITRSAQAEKPLFRVIVSSATVMPRARRITLTGRTQSDQRVTISARTSGIVRKIAVQRGATVKVGDLIVELSDDAREANVAQARARLAQRAAELQAREALAQRGNYPTLNLEQLRAEKQGAEAALASAETELLRANIVAPIAGIVNDLPVEIGQGVQIGATVAEIIAPDPMLAVIELPERRLSSIKVSDPAEIELVTGEKRKGEIRFISRRPTAQTRTYRVDVGFANPDAAIAEGVTCEMAVAIPDGIAADVALVLAPVDAVRVPRSALTFSAEGQLGLRIVDPDDIVRFVPVVHVDDEDSALWVSGVRAGVRIIVRGQDFIAEGQKVEPVSEGAGADKSGAVKP
ncbi:MAG TPA: efflux RND transporter periplasmic adaptor subunit [Rhabdaerophilum sp.]|nr:efflux RND transporter periplasmic adaptor subunit [Rhabdaerophilum sp.]